MHALILGIKTVTSNKFHATGVTDDFGVVIQSNSQTFRAFLKEMELVDANRYLMWEHRMSCKFNF